MPQVLYATAAGQTSPGASGNCEFLRFTFRRLSHTKKKKKPIAMQPYQTPTGYKQMVRWLGGVALRSIFKLLFSFFVLGRSQTPLGAYWNSEFYFSNCAINHICIIHIYSLFKPRHRKPSQDINKRYDAIDKIVFYLGGWAVFKILSTVIRHADTRSYCVNVNRSLELELWFHHRGSKLRFHDQLSHKRLPDLI